MQFKTRDGEVLTGIVVHQYIAFEGGMRYILVANNREYRCVKDTDGNLIEYVA